VARIKVTKRILGRKVEKKAKKVPTSVHEEWRPGLVGSEPEVSKRPSVLVPLVISRVRHLISLLTTSTYKEWR